MRDTSQRFRQGEPAVYEIRVQGWISERWASWFDDMAITLEDDGYASGITALTGVVTDQAALLGLLQKLYTLGFPLLLIRRKAED